MQTWSEARKIKTSGTFDIAERHGYFCEGGTRWVVEKGLYAQTYVFAWNPVYEEYKKTDHRDPTQWEFYVLPTGLLPAGRLTLSLARVKSLSVPHGPTSLAHLADRIEQVTPRRVAAGA